MIGKKKNFHSNIFVACPIICSRFAEQCISNTLKSTLRSIHVQTSTKYDITKENWDDDRAFFRHPKQMNPQRNNKTRAKFALCDYQNAMNADVTSKLQMVMNLLSYNMQFRFLAWDVDYRIIYIYLYNYICW